MERTQILLDEKVKKEIKQLGGIENKSMASVVFRDANQKLVKSQQEALLSMFKTARKTF